MKDVIAYLACAALLPFAGWRLWSGFASDVVRGYTPIRRDQAPAAYWLTMLIYAAAFALIGFVLGYAIIRGLLAARPISSG
jgi:hypothetical protein